MLFTWYVMYTRGHPKVHVFFSPVCGRPYAYNHKIHVPINHSRLFQIRTIYENLTF
jgi:hypothetical protein